jgi:hypothetical protein
LASNHDRTGAGPLTRFDEIGIYETFSLVYGLQLLGEVVVADASHEHD